MSQETSPQQLQDIVDTELRHVLAKRGDTRSYDDLLVLKSKISQIDYIRRVFAELHPVQKDELCKCMTMEIFEENEFIFNQGDKGDKFYVVLSGSCDILIKQRTGIYVQNEDGSRSEQYNYQVIHTCGVGQQFGERALDYDEPRAATVRAGAFSELLTVTQQAYRKILKVPDYNVTSTSSASVEDSKGMVNRVLSYTRDKRKENELHAVSEYLSSRIPFFQKFDLDNRIELIRMCELVKVWGKTTLFEQGDQGQAFYIILTGSVEIFVNGTESNEQILVSTLQAGASFGERALEADSGGKRSATIVTSDEVTELIIVNRQEFQSIVSVMLEGDMMSRVRLLRATELFAPMELTHLHKIARILTPRTFRLNAVLFKAGDLAKDVYIIHKGECTLDTTLKMENGGEEIVNLGRAGQAAVLGDYTFNAESYYDEVYYKETAVSTSLCATFAFSKIDLFNVLSFEIRSEIINRIQSFTPKSTPLWDITPQAISEGDWCIRETWKNFRNDMINQKDRTYSDKSITTHFRDHVKAYNSIGLAKVEKKVVKVPNVRANRFARTSTVSYRNMLPNIEVISPRELTGLVPVTEGRQSVTKFSVYKPVDYLGNDLSTLLDNNLSMNIDEDDSLWGDDDEREKAWRGRKKKLEDLGKRTQKKQVDIHGPAGAGHLHVQSQLGNNSNIVFNPFTLVQFHRSVNNTLGARRHIETAIRFCGSFESGVAAKEAAESQVLNCYIKINKLVFNVKWHRFTGYENMPVDLSEHFIVFCRSVPVEYASFQTVEECQLAKMPFPPSCKLTGQKYACVSVKDVKRRPNENASVERSELAAKEFLEDTLHPLYAREIGVVDEVFAVSHTRLECTRFSCLALTDRVTLPPNCKLIVATLYHWYSVTEDVMLSLVPAELEATALKMEKEKVEANVNNADDSTVLLSEFNSILEAYGGDQATSASRRDVDLYSLSSITKKDVKCMRRDVHSRGLTSRVDHRLKTAPLQSRKRPTLLQKTSNEENKLQQDKNSMFMTDANYITRRENIKALIESRKEIIKKNDEYCDTEMKLLRGNFQQGNSAPPSRQANGTRKDKLMGERELMQSVSTQRLDVLNSLHNAPTLTAVKSDTAILTRRLKKEASVRSIRNNHGNNQPSSSGTHSANISVSESLQQKLDVLEDLMMQKSNKPPASPKRVTVLLS